LEYDQCACNFFINHSNGQLAIVTFIEESEIGYIVANNNDCYGAVVVNLTTGVTWTYFESRRASLVDEIINILKDQGMVNLTDELKISI
jgi:hypothetical protein